MDDARFSQTLQRIDQANAEDPRVEAAADGPQPRELLFARRVYEWVQTLVAEPSEELLLAARAHTLRRWLIPRETYPKTRGGYHAWRSALAAFHAEQADAILADVGYPESIRVRVRALITKENWRNDLEGQALEDADCLAFLELKLHTYLDEWDDEKTVDILRKTLRKMTAQAIQLAGQLPMDARCLALLERAAGN